MVHEQLYKYVLLYARYMYKFRLGLCIYQELATKEKQADATSTEEDKFANADEDSLEIFKEAKALAAKEQISFRDALLKLNI